MATRVGLSLANVNDAIILRDLENRLLGAKCFAIACLLKHVHTGDYNRRFRRQFVAENGDCQNGDCRRFRRQLPFSVTVWTGLSLSTLATIVADFGDSRRIRRQSSFSATVAVFGDSVDRALDQRSYSQFSDRSINHVTILSTDAGHPTPETGHVSDFILHWTDHELLYFLSKCKNNNNNNNVSGVRFTYHLFHCSRRE